MNLVYFSPVTWGSFDQRSHKFVEWFHKKCGGHVLWVEPYPTRLPVLSDFKINKNVVKHKIEKIKPEWLAVIQPKSLPIEPFPVLNILNGLLWDKLLFQIDEFIRNSKCILVVGKPSRLAFEVLVKNPDVKSFLDLMDDFPEFYNGLSKSSMQIQQEKIIKNVDEVIVTSTNLLNKYNVVNNISLIKNACAVDGLPSVQISYAQETSKVIGYIGSIGCWFDWSLVFSIARINPSVTVRIIGPLYNPPDGQPPQNIELLPPCGHIDAVRAMQEFTVGLIPFFCNELTNSVDPIKYYEYKSLGLPVLSTRFGEMDYHAQESGVFIIDSDKNKDFKSTVTAALEFEYVPEEITEFRARNNWEERFNASGILS